MNGAPMMFGQYLPADSVIHKMNAKIKLIFMLALFAAIICAKTVIAYAFVSALIAAVVFASKTGIRSAVFPIRRLWLFLLVIFLMNSFFYGGETEIFRLARLSVTEQGVLQGLKVVLNVALITILSSAVMSTVSQASLKRAVISLLAPLKLFRVPTEDIALIISASLQLMPVFRDEAATIKMAQTARGAGFNSKSVFKRVKSYPTLVIPVFVQALRRADELALAIESRGYVRSRDRKKKTRSNAGHS